MDRVREQAREREAHRARERVRVRLFQEVLDERGNQDRQYGPEHDDQHSREEWLNLLVRHLGLATDDGSGRAAEVRYRQQLLRVAALALAALESYDRQHPPDRGVIVLRSDKGY
jgi:hypothetical protein